jgi:hypothetical protein
VLGLNGMIGMCRSLVIVVLAAAALALGSCAPAPVAMEHGNGELPAPPVRMGVPVGLQMVKTEAQLRKYPFFNLLSFESEADGVFAKVEGTGQLDGTVKHTGAASLKMGAGTRGMVIKLSALHVGRDWPGDWALVGAYFYAEQAQRISAAYEVDGAAVEKYTVELPARQWTPVLLEVNGFPQEKAPGAVATLRFSFDGGLAAPVWCDDVIELNNAVTLVDDNGFVVRERGFAYFLEKPRAFRVMLKTPEATGQGWRMEEASEIRASFSSRGNEKFQAIYSDGRRFVDGEYKPLGWVGDSHAIALAHATPAAIHVEEDFGRVDRNTAGDANNDGYNEQSGSYQVVANGPRVEFSIVPNTSLLVRPVIEIRDLPAGEVTGTMEGILLRRIVRLRNGHTLVELPGGLERGVTVNLKVVK